jgi:hypothetical protein
MKNKIYAEVSDVINNYNNFQKSIIFSLIKEKLYDFNKEVISSQLTIKLNEVLQALLPPTNKRIENPLFSVPDKRDIIEEFSEYLAFRYQSDLGFNRIFYQDWRGDKLKYFALRNFNILQNRFLDQQIFYFDGLFDAHENNYPAENGIPEGLILLYGIFGSKAYGALDSYLKREFINRLRLTESPRFVYYGKLVFDKSMGVNIINVSKVYYD